MAKTKMCPDNVVGSCYASSMSHHTSAKFCWRCGEELVEMALKCDICKGDLSPSDKFCPKCGKPVQHITKGMEDDINKIVQEKGEGC